jgi:hypothetical protein
MYSNFLRFLSIHLARRLLSKWLLHRQMYQMKPFFLTDKPFTIVPMQVQAEKFILDVPESNKVGERRSVFARLVENETGAVEDCLKQHGKLVWAIAKKHADSAADAEKMTEGIFGDIWKYAAAFGVNIIDEKEFVALIAYRYLLKSKGINIFDSPQI